MLCEPFEWLRDGGNYESLDRFHTTWSNITLANTIERLFSQHREAVHLSEVEVGCGETTNANASGVVRKVSRGVFAGSASLAKQQSTM
jgi:hypothetical protein